MASNVHFKDEGHHSFAVVDLVVQRNSNDLPIEQGNHFVTMVKHYSALEGMNIRDNVTSYFRVEMAFQVLKRSEEGSMHSVVNVRSVGRFADLDDVLHDESDDINPIAP